MRFRCPHLPLYNIKRGDKGKAAPAHSYAKQTAFYIKQGPRRSSRILPWLAKGTSVYSPRTLAALLSDTSRILSWPADQQDRRRSSHDGRSEVWRLSRVGLGRFCGGLSAVAIPTIAHGSIYPWIHVSMDPWIHGSMDRWIPMDPWIHGSMGPWIHGSMDPWIHGYMDPSIHGSLDPWIHGSMDPWIHGSMDPWIHGSMDR